MNSKLLYEQTIKMMEETNPYSVPVSELTCFQSQEEVKTYDLIII